VISASGSGLAAFICGHATASASTIDIFVVSSRLWIVAARSVSALARGSPLPRDYAGQPGQDGRYGTNAHLACVAGKVILTSAREGETGVSVEVFSGVDGSILSESFLSSAGPAISPDARRVHVDAPMHAGLQQYQRHSEDTHPSQHETRVLHDNHHDVLHDTPATFETTVPAYIDSDRTRDNKHESDEDDRQETLNRNGRLRYTSGQKNVKTRGRQSMVDSDRDLNHTPVTSTRSYMSAEHSMRWKLATIQDGDGAVVFAGSACIDNFWNCTSRTSTVYPSYLYICANTGRNTPKIQERYVNIYDDVEDPLRVTGSFREYTWICCDANVVNPVICSLDTHYLFFSYSPAANRFQSWKSRFFLHAGGEGAVICQLNTGMCNNVDSSGVIQSPSAVIEVLTDGNSMVPSEV